jgi:tetratricopeptide (TPR) repeat protein
MEKQQAAPANAKIIPLKMDAMFFFERAVKSLNRYHYGKALKYFRRAVEFEPDNPVNHCNMAGILSEIGNYEESNRILERIIDEIDPTMTECYFYMANNYANMENYILAEKALINYLERDPHGYFLEEAEEMMDFLSYELNRPVPVIRVKSREGLLEHDRARFLLEKGHFSEAIRVLEHIVRKYPDFLAARNNLALAYYYKGRFADCLRMIEDVLKEDPGNLHALCNLAIYYQHVDSGELPPLLELLAKTYPYQPEHCFKLAMTLGLLGEHEAAYRNFRRLLMSREWAEDPALYHYTAVSAFYTGRWQDARSLWQQAAKADPDSPVPKFYLDELDRLMTCPEKSLVSYHYLLPIEEKFSLLETAEAELIRQFAENPLMRSAFFWAFRHGDHDTKVKIIRVFSVVPGAEVEEALRAFLLSEESDYLKKMVVFILRSRGIAEPLRVRLGGKEEWVTTAAVPSGLPVWQRVWQMVIDAALERMADHYDMIEQYDLQTLWIEYLARVYPEVPRIRKIEGWAAALEYLTAKMHLRKLTYREAAERYGVSVSTVAQKVKMVDQVLHVDEKIAMTFFPFRESF